MLLLVRDWLVFNEPKSKSCLSLFSDATDGLRVLILNVGRKTRRYERSTYCGDLSAVAF